MDDTEKQKQTIENLVSRAKAIPKQSGLDVSIDEFRLLYGQGGKITVGNRDMGSKALGSNYKFHVLHYEGCNFRTLTKEEVDFSQW